MHPAHRSRSVLTNGAICLIGLAGAPGAAPAAQDAPGASTMAEARRVRPEIDTVTIAGRALVDGRVFNDRALLVALQDGPDGLWVFSRPAPRVAVRAGDSVVATGVLHRYRGTTEIVATRVSVVAGARRLPEAPAVGQASTASVVAREGRLLRLRGRVGAQGASEGGHWLRLHRLDGAAVDSVTLWVPAAHQRPPGLEALRAGDRVEVTGLATLYRDNPTDAAVAQLLPRGPEDIVTLGIPGLWRERALHGTIAVLLGGLLLWQLVRLVTGRQERALRETEARYRQLLELSPDAVVVHEEDRVLFANPAAARLLGVPDEHALAGRPLDTFLGDEARAALAVAANLAPTRDPRVDRPVGRRLRTHFRHADGSVVDVEVATSPCRYSDREAAVIVARDIGPQLRYERELRELALLDELTGLHNRRGFLTFAEADLRRLRHAGNGAMLVFADLDGLKRINDAHGHAAGDEALIAVANALREVVGAQGLVARWSGDEFAALVPDPHGRLVWGAADDAHHVRTDLAAADAFEQRLRACLARHDAPHTPYTVSATVGAHHLPADGGETLAAALAAADAGLYRRRAAVRQPTTAS